MSEERLQKILAQAGIASRRAAEKFISEGRVRVNGEVVNELGAKANPEEDTIEVDGLGIVSAEPVVYIAMHKPIHVVTTVSDPEGRQTVIDVIGMSRAEGRKSFEGNMPRIFPVGRLDFDAEGLLLLTNDGALANDLLHPKFHVPKTYVVKVTGRPDERQLGRLQQGVRLREEDGSLSRKTAPAEVRVVRESPANTWLELVITEGRHHQVKRMCDSIGHSVIRLIRTEMGGVELSDLEPGHWRFLTEVEVALLKAWKSGDAQQIREQRGPTTTQQMFGELRPGAKKRSGAPRERGAGAPRARVDGAPRGRGDGAPRSRSEEGARDERPQARTFRADRDGGRPRVAGGRVDRAVGGRSEGRPASRGPRSEGGAPGRAPRGEGRAPSRGPRDEGRAPSRAPRGEGRDFAPRGDRPSRGMGERSGGFGGGRGRNDFDAGERSRAPRGDFDGARRGPPRGRDDGGYGGDDRGAPRARASRDEGFGGEGRGRAPSGSRGFAPPRGVSRGQGGPRGDGGPRGERSGGARFDGPRSGGASRGGPRSDGPRSGGASRGGPRSDGPRSGGASRGGPRSDGPRSGGASRGGPRSEGPRSGGGGARGPRSGGRAPRRG